MFVNERWCKPGHCMVKVELCCKDIELLAVSMRPFYLPWEFTVIVIAVYVPPLLRLTLPVIHCSQLPAGCRHGTHRPSFSSLGTSTMLPPPLCCQHLHSTSPVLPGTIKHLIGSMRTPRRYILHPHCLPLAELTTTSSIYSLCINLWCTDSLWRDAW